MKLNTKLIVGISLLAALALAGCSNGNVLGASSVPASSQTESTDQSASSQAESTDQPAADGAVLTVGKLSVALPEGWTLPDDPSVIYAPDYPNDSSNMSVQESAKDPSFSLYSKDMLKGVYDTMLTKAMGTKVDTIMDGFDKVKVGDYNALRIALHYDVNGVKISQLQYMVDADSSYAITYTQMDGADWMDAFDASAKTIQIAK